MYQLAPNKAITNYDEEARINFSIDLDQFHIEIFKPQFDCLIKILNHISKYNRFQYSYYETRKYRYFRPVSNCTKLKLFKYAIEMVIKRIKHNRGVFYVFDLPKNEVKSYEENFTRLFHIYYNNHQDLKDENLLLFKKIIETIDMEKLYSWTLNIVKEIYKKNKIEENKKQNNGLFSKLFGIKKTDIESYNLTKEEEEKIEEILKYSLDEVQANLKEEDKELKFKINFKLKSGYFKFSKNFITYNAKHSEGFQFKFANVDIGIAKSEIYTELDASLKDFLIEMVTTINENINILPISFRSNNDILKLDQLRNKQSQQRDGLNLKESSKDLSRSYIAPDMISIDDQPIWKLKLKSYGPGNDINSEIYFEMNEFNLIYHQVLLDRIINFFIVEINDDLANKAWNKWEELKTNTQQSLREAMSKKNIISMNIKSRKIIIPVNRYDLKNSKWFQLDIGEISMENKNYNDIYSNRYNSIIKGINFSFYENIKNLQLNINAFHIISDISAIIGLALLPENYSNKNYPNFKLFVDIENAHVQATEYLYTLFEYIIEIFRPAIETDLFSEINQTSQEIKKKSSVASKILKRNPILKNWEEYFACLSGGYIYFYMNSTDDEYIAYYYIKDCDILHHKEESNTISLKNSFGVIDLKFQNFEKMKKWIFYLNERIEEMKFSYDAKAKELDIINKSKKFDAELIYFGLEININNAHVDLYNEEKIQYSTSHDQSDDYITHLKKLFVLEAKSLNFILNMRDFDTTLMLSLREIILMDYFNLDYNKKPKLILKSVKSKTNENSSSNRWNNNIPSSQSNITNDSSERTSISFLKEIACINVDDFLNLEIIVADENSSLYENILINIKTRIGSIEGFWYPDSVRRLLLFVAHNDILRDEVKKEIELTMEKINRKNFIQKMENEMLNRLICTEIKHTYLKLKLLIVNINLIWIQPILETYFFQIKIMNKILNFDMTDDHFVIGGSLEDFLINDLSNYPFTIKSPEEYKHNKIKVKELLSSNDKNNLTYEYKSMNKWCPYCIDNYSSEAYVNIYSANLFYIQENFLRFFNYLMGEFLGSFGPLPHVAEYRNAKNQIEKVDPKDIEFLRLYVIINSAKIILKARPQYKETFYVDLGTLIITSGYQKTYNKIRDFPEEFRWLVTYKFEVSNFNISTEDEFYLLNHTNGIANMHFTYLTDHDMKQSDLQVDKSFQIDVLLDQVNINMRQKDYINILKLNDLNLSYFDYLDQYFDYPAYREKQNNIANKLNKPANEKKKDLSHPLYDKFFDIIFNLLINQINVNLHINSSSLDKELKIFSKLSLNKVQLDFFRKLNTNKEIAIIIESPKIYQYMDKDMESKIYDIPSQKEIIFSHFNVNVATNNDNLIDLNLKSKSSNRIQNFNSFVFDYDGLHENFSKYIVHESKLSKTNDREISIKIMIDKDREKSYLINLSNLKMIIKFDTIFLIKQFFMEGFPYYSNFDEDIPNLYEENEENYPGMKLFLEIRNSILCFLSNNVEIKNQDVICLSTDVVLGLKIEKISKVKSELIENHTTLSSLINMTNNPEEKIKLVDNLNDDKQYIYSMNVSLFDVCPFIINYSEFLNSNSINLFKKRKLIDNFMFIYEYQTFLKFIPTDRFILFNESKFDLNKIFIKASYRDLVLILKCYEYNRNSLGDSYKYRFDDLYFYSKLKKECEKKKGHEIQRIERKSSIRKSVITQKSQINRFNNVSEQESSILISKPEEEDFFQEDHPVEISKLDELINIDKNLSILNESKNEDKSLKEQEINRPLLKRHSIGFDDINDDVDEYLNKNEILNFDLQKTSFEKYGKSNKFLIIDKGLFTQNLLLQGFQMILIDDHDKSYHPFLSIDIQDFNLLSISLNFNQNQTCVKFNTKVFFYNYLGAVWEPLLERTLFEGDITSSKTHDNFLVKNIDIKFPINQKKSNSILNINISDSTISFLTKTLLSWIQKFSKLKANYSEEIKNILKNEENMKISNHTLFNYTGRRMKIYKLYKSDKSQTLDDVKYLDEIEPGATYDIEYFNNLIENDNLHNMTKNLLKENYIVFELDGVKASDKIIKIDTICAQKHSLDYRDLKKNFKLEMGSAYSKFEYIVSLIKIDQIKHSIYFYSPLSFTNKSDKQIRIRLRREGVHDYITILNNEETLGIPYEYFDGFIQFDYLNFNPITYELRKFLTAKYLEDEMNFNGFLFCFYFKSSFTDIDRIDPFKNILITSPFIIRNLLPFDFIMHINDGRALNPIEYRLKKTEKIHINDSSIHNELSCSIHFLKFRTLSPIKLYCYKSKNVNEAFIVEDQYKNKLKLCVCLIDAKTRTIGIYSSGVLINNTLLDFFNIYYFNKKKKELVAGQGENVNILLLSDEKYMIIEYKDFISQPFSLGVVGINIMLELKNKQGRKIEFFVESKLSLISPDLNIYSNILDISPRFIIYNKLDHEVLIGVLENSNEKEIINSKQRKPFYFFGYGSETNITFRVLEHSNNKYQSGSKWNWSSPVSLKNDRVFTFQIMSLDGSLRKFINIEKKIDLHSTFLILKETTHDDCQFLIENHCKTISLKLWQHTQEASGIFLNPKSTSIFSWIDFQNKKIFNVQPIIGILDSHPLIIENSQRSYELLDDKVNILNPNSMNLEKSEFYPYVEIFEIKTGPYNGYTIKIEFQTNGFKKIIKITDKIDQTLKSHKISFYQETQFNLSIENLGISLISDNKHISSIFNHFYESNDFLKTCSDSYVRNEIFYISLKDLKFYLKDADKDHENTISMQLKIGEIEIDNEFSYLTHFPIVLRPLHSEKFNPNENHEEFVNPSGKDNNLVNLQSPPFLNFLVLLTKGNNEDRFKINLLNYLIQSAKLCFDSSVLDELLNFFTNIALETKTTFTPINRVFIDNKKNILDGVFIKDNYFDPLWLYMDLEKESKKIFIQQLENSPIEIQFSFISQGANTIFQKFLGSNPIRSSLISTLSNIENANIEINGSIMNNVYGDEYQIFDSIIDNYKQGILKQIFKIFGAIDIIGNPANFLNTLGTGFKDFFQKPYKGIVKGPLEGAKGIMDGSISLVKHTVEGTFSSTSKITSGLSHGILYITQDHEYINDIQKKKITEKPKNFIEGIGYGITSMAGGLYHGVTDIVMKPIEGAKKEKWAGFGKGLMKGLAGVVAKPISGVLELVSKTSEGIKNTVVNDQFLKMERLPRTFYGKFKFIKSYNPYHAQINAILKSKIDKLKHANINFYSCEIYKNQKEENNIMVFTTESVMTIDIRRRELKSNIEYSQIKDIVQIDSNKLKLVFRREINNKKHVSFSFSRITNNIDNIKRKLKDAIENNYQRKLI